MKARVLIGDDNRELADNIAEILEAEGYESIVSAGPHEALRIARDTDFDVAVLDVRMPGMDGVTLHSELARPKPCATLVLMTAYAGDERIDEALRAGVRTVLPDPVPVEELLAELPALEAEAEVPVVEDDAAPVAALSEVLGEHGFRARRASSVAQARRTLEAHSPGAVVADIRLPDGNGAELAREIRSIRDVPVVLMTAFETSEAARTLRQHHGVCGVLLTKPFPAEDLLAALRRLGSEGA